LQLVDTSIDIYFKLGMDLHIKELIHLYEGKALSLRNLKRPAESADAFEEIAKLYQIDDDANGYLRAKRAAACDWFDAREWQKSLDGHLAAQSAIDPDATPISMGTDLLNIGTAQIKLNMHTEAVVTFLSARQIFKREKNPEYVNWADQYLTITYAALENGPEAKFHAKHYFNYSKVAEDMSMEGFARYRLGIAHLLCQEYEDAERQLVSALEQLTLDENKDWEEILGANQALAKALAALGREEEANTRLERIATIAETIFGDEKAA
jgi:tetratricopeptide (TPR) repeat protein